MPKSHAFYPVGTHIVTVIGPTKVTREGIVVGHEGQFLVFETKVKGKTKRLKTRPGSLVRG